VKNKILLPASGYGKIIAQSEKKVKSFLIIGVTNLDFLKKIVYNIKEMLVHGEDHT
jgi:hypothetical protein